jgi:uncharacterized protein YndB with AHSA1/START domain
MTRSPEPVTDDTDAAPGAATIADVGPMIVASVALPGCPPGRALAAFTDPPVLARWWRGELTCELVPGGAYSVSFPAIAARLAGRVVDYVPGSMLRFSWAWDGADDHPASIVTVRATATAGPAGTVLTIEHGPHAEGEGGRTARAEHRAGWEFFLPRLPAAVKAGARGGQAP